jgi:DNA-directed RNA polymerase specialized sigma24 family protein
MKTERDALMPDTFAAAQRGDPFAFLMLFQWRARPVAAYLDPVAGEAEQQRLLERIFVRAWRELPSAGRHDSFDLWLLRLAHREARRDEDRAPASEPAGRRTKGDEVAAALHRLPERLREVLSLRYLFGQTVEQVAASFGASADDAARWDRDGLEELATAAGYA